MLHGAGADSDGGNSPSVHGRGPNFGRGYGSYRGYAGMNPTPLGYARGDSNAAWEVMSDEGSASGQSTCSPLLLPFNSLHMGENQWRGNYHPFYATATICMFYSNYFNSITSL